MAGKTGKDKEADHQNKKRADKDAQNRIAAAITICHWFLHHC